VAWRPYKVYIGQVLVEWVGSGSASANIMGTLTVVSVGNNIWARKQGNVMEKRML
jgi:hypothetical protein